MMKLKKRLVAILLMGIFVGSSFATVTFSAAQPNSEVTISESTYVTNATRATFNPIFLGSPENEFSSLSFPSLAAAQMSFGYDWEYRPCSVNYAGNYYNYCYAFSEGGHCFFYVNAK